MKKLPLSWTDIEKLTGNICREISLSDWRPDYVVGITRGGNVPATMISHYFNTRCEALKVSLRDTDTGSESNLWMAEDAFGYIPQDEQAVYKSRWDVSRRKKILIVDDINDTGATFNWIKHDWTGSCLPHEETWNTVWGYNVRFATLIDNQSSDFHDVAWSGIEINKAEDDAWVEFPWEDWWKR